MKKLIVITLLVVCNFIHAQDKGTISGLITDKEMNGESLPFANVFIKGTAIGTTTDMDGKYLLSVPAGSTTIVFSFVGYQTIEKTIIVKANQPLVINQELSANEGVSLDEIVIKAAVSRDKESALLLEQKKAVSIKTSIGAQELSKKGVSDAAAAVTKISGVSKQESSGSVFVRGLGDRYNITTLNGLPLPSNNPNRKNINLTLFSTDIVQSIGVSKTFEAQNYGDFAGANVDIKSKNYKGKGLAQIKIGIASINSNVIEKKDIYLQDGPNYFGFKNIKNPSNPTSEYQYATSWDRKSNHNLINNNFGISVGKSFEVSEESKLNTFFTASFNNNTNFRDGIIRGAFNTLGVPATDYTYDSYTYQTNTTAMGTVNYFINPTNSITFNSLFLNSSSQNYTEYAGTNNEFDGGTIPAEDNETGFIKRGTYDKTSLFVNQLIGKNNFSERTELNWAVGYSMLLNDTPDRMQNTFIPSRVNVGEYAFFANSPIDNHRFFQELKENELSTNIDISYNFSKNEDDAYDGKVILGYSGRLKNIDFESNLYSFTPNTPNLFNFEPEDIHNVDQIFNQENLDTGKYSIFNIFQEYNGNQYINAVFLKSEYKFSPKLTALVGVRGEFIIQNIDYNTVLVPEGDSSKYDKIEILPSLMAKYKINDKNNIKFAASKSYTLPQFKERVEMPYEEVTQSYIGNPDLYVSTNYNFDLGWEMYPSSGEIISFNAFHKIIQNPINEVFVNSASGDITYVNSGEKAQILGAELETKMTIFKNEDKDKLSFGANITYMHQEQDFDGEKVSTENKFGANFTYDTGKLSGASDLLANADFSYNYTFSEKSDLTTTLTWSYFSDKLRTIGTQGRGHFVDLSNQNLDLIIKYTISKKLRLGLSAKNILNPTYETIQESTNSLVNSYKRGVGASFSLTYKLY